MRIRISKHALLFSGIAVIFAVTAMIIIYYNHYNNFPGSSSLHEPIIANHYAGMDKFGIKEIYPTKMGGEQWFMNMNDIVHDPRTSFTASPPVLTKNLDNWCVWESLRRTLYNVR